MTQSANIRLTGKQLRLLEEGIRNAFVDYRDLERLVLYELDERLNDIVVVQATFRDQIMQLIQWAEVKGKTKEFLLAAVKEVPGNVQLRAAKEAVLGADELDDLEKIVSRNPTIFSNPDAWRQAMIHSEWTVCRVEMPEGRALGTAFLVAADVVLTNDHVAQLLTSPASVCFRFGFRELAEVGTTYGLAASWEIHSSPADKLDYALLRLSGKAGEGSIGDFKDAPRRGWLKLQQADVEASQGLFILQHPGGDTLKMANGGVRGRSGAWVEYEIDTLPGSSGSPVFNNKWELVALHSRAGMGRFNKGVAVAAIVDDMPSEVRKQLGAARATR